MSQNVLVLGCGPAGLMVAHAAALNGHDIKILSKKRKSRMFGCQYLHHEIPGITEGSPTVVRYELRGTVAQYREKVYGRNYRGTVSPEELCGQHFAWDIRAAYDRLWEMYSDYVIDWEVADPSGWEHVLDAAGADIVYSTVPAPSLCRSEEHSFGAQEVYAIGDAPELGQACPVPAPESTVLCNGEAMPAWYRVSRVFGHTTAEWILRPPFDGVAKVLKPIKTDCTCYSDVTRAGRYGKWEKGVLSSDAFNEAMEVLSGNG